MNLMIVTLAIALTACRKEKPAELAPAKPIILTEQESVILKDVNVFTFDLYREMGCAKPGKDMTISPLSASLALSLLSTGARNVTADEITGALGFDCGAEDISSFYNHLMTEMLDVDPSTTLESANSIWADKRLELQKDFVKSADKYFKAEIRNVDFTSAGTTGKINAWCSEKTHGKIKTIVDQVDPNTLVALLNAMYFNGKWRNKFDGSHSGTFRCADGRTANAEMMTNKLTCSYSEDGKFRMVELAYGNGAFAMDIVLPVDENPEKFSSYSTAMTGSEWDNLTSGLVRRSVQIELPSFKMECEYDLIPYLKSLGINLAFTGDADFSGISEVPLYVSDVKQKTFINVGKEGTEAAAVTYIGMKMTSAGPEETVSFIADRPFIYAIRETSTGAILFIGQKTE